MKAKIYLLIILFFTIKNNAQSPNYFNLTFEKTFPHGVSNQVVYINFPDVHLWGNIVITVTGGFNYQLNKGLLKKRITIMRNYSAGGGGYFNQSTEIETSSGELANQWNIGDFDNVNRRIPIYHIVNSGNDITIQVEGLLRGSSIVSSIKSSLSLTGPEIETNSKTRQYMSLMEDRVGIGTKNPTENLSIYSDQARLSVTGPSGISAIMLGNQDSNGIKNPAIIAAANGSLFFGGGNSWVQGGDTLTSLLSVYDDSNRAIKKVGIGKVGIGTGFLEPSAKLEVFNKTAGTTSLRTMGVNGYMIIDNVGSGENYFNANEFHEFKIHDNSVMKIDNKGYVGIGTTDPKNQLSVNGTIWAKAVKVSLTDAADWVFDKNYKLRPLAEVEKYINQNKHLPEIPSAEEFRQNDLNVSEMTNKLLQKIEELTLYVIELKKEIESLKKENKNDQNLAQRLEVLEAKK